MACQSDSLIEPAVAAARSADVTVLLLGLNLGEENEGADRRSLELPGFQSLLLRRVANASARPVILVLLCGGPVDVSEAAEWARVGAVIWMGYPGQAGGEALARVLFGDFNPSETNQNGPPVELRLFRSQSNGFADPLMKNLKPGYSTSPNPLFNTTDAGISHTVAIPNPRKHSAIPRR